MMYKGRVVLDPDNHPVRDFREIPATISSAVEGWLMEAIRRTNSKITSVEFRARMLRKPSADGKVKLITANGVEMRMARWRQAHRCISWVNRGGSKAFRDHLWGLMTKDMRDNNTTEGLEDVEDKGELARMKVANQGQFLSRAGPRAIPDHLREHRQRKVIEKAMRFDEGQATKERNKIRKRKRAHPVNEHADDGSNLLARPSRRRKVNTTPLNAGTPIQANTPPTPNNMDYPIGRFGEPIAFHDTEALRYKSKIPQNSAYIMGPAQSLTGDESILPGSSVLRHKVPAAYQSTQSPIGDSQMLRSISTPTYPSSAAASAHITTSLEAASTADVASQLSQNRRLTHPVHDDDLENRAFHDWQESENAKAHQAYWTINPNCAWETNKGYSRQDDFDLQEKDLAAAGQLNYPGTVSATHPPHSNNDNWSVEESSCGNEGTEGDTLPEVDFDVWTEGHLYHN